jgi:Holliday junction resolvasome RuvABC endonuclease subunit
VIQLRILSFDQSTKLTGWAFFNNKELEGYGIIDGSKIKNLDEKLLFQKNKIIKLYNNFSPDFVIIEDIQYQKNIFTYKELAELLGIISNYFYEHKINYLIIPPSQWKSYCDIKGRKRAEQKENTIQFVKNKFNIDVSDDIADAICIGWYGTNIIKER